MAVDIEGYESLYLYLLSWNRQYVSLLRRGVSHEQMIDEKLLGESLSVEDLRQAEKDHLDSMTILRRDGNYCQVSEGRHCNIQEIAEGLISQIRFTESDDNEPSGYDTSTEAGCLQQRASNRHNRSNYDEIIRELPGCSLCILSNDGRCDDHLSAYWSIKQAATF